MVSWPSRVTRGSLILEREKLLGTESLIMDLSGRLNEILQVGTDGWRKSATTIEERTNERTE